MRNVLLAGLLGAWIFLPRPAAAMQTYICGYAPSAASPVSQTDIVITVNGATAVASACHPSKRATGTTFQVIENNPSDLVFARGIASTRTVNATSVFGLDKTTGRLFHCLNVLRFSSDPVWIGNCVRPGDNPVLPHPAAVAGGHARQPRTPRQRSHIS